MSKPAKKIKVTQPRTKPAAKAAEPTPKAAAKETAKKAAASAAEAPRAGKAAKAQPASMSAEDAARLPPVGTVIKKLARDGRVRCECKIEAEGVRYDGEIYKSLSGAAVAAAKALGLSGSSFNGYVFWGLAKPARASADPAVRLDKLWARYEEAASALLKGAGAEKGGVLAAMKPHAARMGRILGANADA